MTDSYAELIFWLEIMRDHCIFELSTLAPDEKAYVELARYYRDSFQAIIDGVSKGSYGMEQYRSIQQYLAGLMEFKRSILMGLLTCQVKINLPPSLINHQINEAMEFYSFLTSQPPLPGSMEAMTYLVDYLKIWLEDCIGHASGLISFLNGTEALLIEEIEKCRNDFEKLVLKAGELQMMIRRTGVVGGALDLLAEQAVSKMECFNNFLERMKKLRYFCMAMATGTLLPLLPDHFIREQKYFISKIENYSDV